MAKGKGTPITEQEKDPDMEAVVGLDGVREEVRVGMAGAVSSLAGSRRYRVLFYDAAGCSPAKYRGPTRQGRAKACGAAGACEQTTPTPST
jgi:hypothetical protein